LSANFSKKKRVTEKEDEDSIADRISSSRSQDEEDIWEESGNREEEMNGGEEEMNGGEEEMNGGEEEMNGGEKEVGNFKEMGNPQGGLSHGVLRGCLVPGRMVCQTGA
jgi:hypothetical protein